MYLKVHSKQFLARARISRYDACVVVVTEKQGEKIIYLGFFFVQGIPMTGDDEDTWPAEHASPPRHESSSEGVSDSASDHDTDNDNDDDDDDDAGTIVFARNHRTIQQQKCAARGITQIHEHTKAPHTAHDTHKLSHFQFFHFLGIVQVMTNAGSPTTN
jgi:hypothetical protein